MTRLLNITTVLFIVCFIANVYSDTLLADTKLTCRKAKTRLDYLMCQDKAYESDRAVMMNVIDAINEHIIPLNNEKFKQHFESSLIKFDEYTDSICDAVSNQHYGNITTEMSLDCRRNLIREHTMNMWKFLLVTPGDGNHKYIPKPEFEYELMSYDYD